MLLATRRSFPSDDVTVLECDDGAAPIAEPVVFTSGFASYAASRSTERWVWPDTARTYPDLLQQRVRIDRCHDLRLCHAILASSQYCRRSSLAARLPWVSRTQETSDATLFDWDADEAQRSPEAARQELQLQLEAVRTSSHPARLRLLLAAESAGALAAAEMTWAGIPWRPDVHDAMLRRTLGPRPSSDERPSLLEEAAQRLRNELRAPDLNPDSPAELLVALRRHGLPVTSTAVHALAEFDTPAVRALVDYRKMARLLAANGWAWQDRWVRGGRFHAAYVPGGVVTGRWAGHGGGVLQLPKQVRGAVIADPGWKLVVADAAQLDPRILAAMAGDDAMIAAGAGNDLYQGIVDRGIVADRRHAKVAMLGAIYGATTGDSARLMPSLTAAFPRAIAMVEEAAQAGRAGRVVTTLLGRSSPAPAPAWREAQRRAGEPGASEALRRAARRVAADRGRFTRNFIVQGTAAEWALCWLAGTRARLARLNDPGADLRDGPHLTYFLHDELMVHTPRSCAGEVARLVREAARAAGRMLFPESDAAFPVTIDIVDRYADVA